MGFKLMRRHGWFILSFIFLFSISLLIIHTPKIQAAGSGNSTVPVQRPAAAVPRAPLAVDANPLEIKWVKKVLAPDGAAGDSFSPVGVSGSTLIVGAWLDDDSGADSGAAYIFSQNQGGEDNWGQVKKLTALDGDVNDFFGFAVAIDSDLAVVGAPQDDSDAGSAYIFARNQGGSNDWGEVRKITASDAASGDQFGSSVAISGDTVIVGAPGEGSSAGAAYLFVRNQGGADNWGEVEIITASDRQSGDAFGTAAAVSQDTVLIGAPGEDTEGDNAGAAYVFARNQGGADNWGQIRKITANDAAANDNFGIAVALDHDNLVVGATGKSSNTGAAYLFARNQGSADNWGQITKLTASDGAGSDQFGAAVALQNDAVVVGAPGEDDFGSAAGAGYLFERNNGGADMWGQTIKIGLSGLEANDGFGSFVGMNENTLVLGAQGDDDQATDAGAAYLYHRNGTAWTQVQKASKFNPQDDDQFGKALDLSGDTLVVGVPYDDNAGEDAGAAFVFSRNQGGEDNWGERVELSPNDRSAGDEFGKSVAIYDDTIVVGAPNLNGNAGAAFVFSRNQGGADQWGQVVKLTASDSNMGDQFGRAVTIHGDVIIVGAPDKDTSVPFIHNTGAAYIFTRNQGGADNWGQVTILTAPDPVAGDWFGLCARTDGSILAISKPNDDTTADEAGSVYLFERNRGGVDNWGYYKKILASDGGVNDRFGWSLALGKDTLVVGAINNDLNGVDAGAAFVFERNAGGLENWGEVTRLDPDHPYNLANLGWAVDIQENFILVGAPNATNGLNQSGAAYLFARNQGGADHWGQLNWIAPPDADDYDFFGSALALDANTIASGMYTSELGGHDTGAVYLYQWDVDINALKITKTGNPGGTVPVGELVEYNLTYVNFFPEIVTGVVITDIIPYPLTNLNYYSSGAAINPIPGQTYAWQVEDLSPGEGGVITIQGEIISGLTEEIEFENTATIMGAVSGITQTWTTDNVTLTVDLPLNAHAGGPYDVGEGSSVLLDASLSSDAGSPITSYAWDLDNDGAYDDASGITTLFSATQDEHVQIIGLWISDGTDEDTVSTTVTVHNVAPVVYAGPGWVGDPGLVVTLPPATYSDPGMLDALTYTLNWGDGMIQSGNLPPGTGTISGSHLYPDPGYYVVSITVTDEDGGVGVDQFTVQLGEMQFLPVIPK